MCLCICSNALGCNCFGIMIHMPFIAISSITASSSLNVQYGHMSCYTSPLLNGQHSTMYALKSYSCMSLTVTFWMSCIILPAGMFVISLIMLTISFMLAIFYLYSTCDSVLRVNQLCTGQVQAYRLCIFGFDGF